ncbi:MAG: bifunctional demethylmenaquinone methyltransferase/2-methoxy-6-polyprenyl-1,4-benzoquinol methylase UbiE [Legionellales bacterium]|nr:MAG: bifunctional demethylmenaquinone methyltransferase/2-methoxy-6-polyprenyl-1,4-benzoquinol methylase UbiE [Legionellales bacterium]
MLVNMSRVTKVFSSVAQKYDLMNDVMSLGIHRIWKRIAIECCALKPGQIVLDLAGGSGDLTIRSAPIVGNSGKIILADYNNAMLSVAQNRLIDAGIVGNVELVQADAQNLPFKANSFDCIIIGFGLRNIPDKLRALQSMQRVLRPGGRVIILEFSKVTIDPLDKIYQAYSQHIIPKLGELISADKASYQYLVDSIKEHPDQDTLLEIMQQAKFADCSYKNLNAGIVAIHTGYKY